jgi:phosphatidylglycerophosphate synthase
VTEASPEAPSEPLPFDAVLLIAPEAHVPVAGTTLLTRAAFTAARAGARRLLCLGTAPLRPPRMPTLPIAWAASEDRAAVDAWLGEASAVVVAAATTVTDPRTLTAFVASADGAPRLAPGGLLWRGTASDADRGIDAVAGATARRASAAAATNGTGRWTPPRAALLVDASTPAGRTEASRGLFERTGRAGDSWFTRHVDRRLSRAITRLLLPTGIAPNAITLTSIAIGVAAGALFAVGSGLAALLGALLFLLSTIVDGCDGEVARLTFRESRFGARLDVIGDNVVHLVLFAGIAVGLYRHTPDRRFVVLGAVLLAGLVVSMATVWWSFVRHRPTSAQRRVFEAFASREFAYVLVLLTAAGLLEWFLWGAAIGNWVFSGALLALGRAGAR